jgi:hypothetical protein
MPLNPREWTLDDTIFLLKELGIEGNTTLSSDQLKLVREQGYKWSKDPVVNNPYPEAALVMDAYARLNEYGKTRGRGRRNSLVSHVS